MRTPKTLFALLSLSIVAAAQAFGVACAPFTVAAQRAGGAQRGGDREVYALFPSLVLSDIPPHNGAGPWGERIRIQQPTLPTTTRSVTVDTQREFNAAAAVDGTHITIAGSGWSGGINTIAGNDIRVTVPQSVAIAGPIEIEHSSRIHVRAPPGEPGGRVGQFRTKGPSSTDLVFEGIKTNGDGAVYGSPGENHGCFRLGEAGAPAIRVAVVGVQCIAAAYAWGGTVEHAVIAGSSFYHGAATRAAVGAGEGWGIRNAGGPLIIWRSDIRGTRYVQVRTHSLDGDGELLYVGESILVATAEGRTLWAWPNLNNNIGIGAAFILERNAIYAYAAGGKCSFGPELSTWQVQYSKGTRNEFFGAGSVVWTQKYLDSLEAGGGGPTAYGNERDPPKPPGTHSWGADEGNTFHRFDALPAWRGAGDPTGIPMPGGLTLITGDASPAPPEPPCPGFRPKR